VIGPVFHREAAIAPRRPRMYIARAGYAAVLLVLMWLAWMLLTGTQLVRDVGDLARFGSSLFQLLAAFQLALALFFSAMLTASAVAQEKDRRTLVLLLLTNLTNVELVLGKLLASLLGVLVMLTAALPIFMLATLLGGISFGQIGRVFAMTLVSVLLAGSLGSTLALWREKTFQALALTVLVLVIWLAFWEIVAAGALGSFWWGLPCGAWAAGFSPWQAVLEASRPYARPLPELGPLGTPVNLFLLVGTALAAALNGVAVARVRVWNPSREARPMRRDEEAEALQSIWEPEHDSAAAAKVPGPLPAATPAVPARGRTRQVWDNPVVWREIRTWAYGRKILVVKLAYLLLFATAAVAMVSMTRQGELAEQATGAVALAGLFLISLVLVNAQAVTSMTSERDGQALDLLLVTDLSAKEIVFGKLGGVFYNAKEVILLPMLLCGYLWYAGELSLENLVYLLGGLAVMYVFVAMLGIHAGMIHVNGQAAIGTSLGTVFFLLVGVGTCMRMMIAFSGSFHLQFLPFFFVMVFGGAGLWLVLGARNPSTAIGVASFLCPIATFYAITSYLLGSTLAVFLVVAGTYGFFTAAMLVPAIYEFDVATGRTTAEEQ
jgi:ABC-type transport system involved in multi-copper enzyme maturation permease subunit